MKDAQLFGGPLDGRPAPRHPTGLLYPVIQTPGGIYVAGYGWAPLIQEPVAPTPPVDRWAKPKRRVDWVVAKRPFAPLPSPR